MFDFSQLPRPLHEYSTAAIIPISGSSWYVVLEYRSPSGVVLLDTRSVAIADRQDRALMLRDELIKTLRAARALVGKA